MNQNNQQPAEPSRASRIEWSLRQIIEADDAQALTQEIIEAGRSALAPHPAQPVEAAGAVPLDLSELDLWSPIAGSKMEVDNACGQYVRFADVQSLLATHPAEPVEAAGAVQAERNAALREVESVIEQVIEDLLSKKGQVSGAKFCLEAVRALATHPAQPVEAAASPSELQQLKALALAATPGPWDWGGTECVSQEHALAICKENLDATAKPGTHFCEVFLADGRRTALVGNGPTGIENAAFIAAANPAVVLDLIARIESAAVSAATHPAEPVGDECPAASEDRVVAAARALCNFNADASGIDRTDSWKVYGNEFLVEARAALAAADAVAPVGGALVAMAEQVETDMADRLRRIVTNIGEGPIAVQSKLLFQAADECDRFYNGMMNWKANAQAKDRTIIELRESAPTESAAAPADLSKLESAFKIALGSLALHDMDEANRIGKMYRDSLATHQPIPTKGNGDTDKGIEDRSDEDWFFSPNDGD